MLRSADYAAGLAALPGAGAVRLGRLLVADDAEAAWHRVVAGRVAHEVAPAAVRAAWQRDAVEADLGELANSMSAAGVSATTWHDPAHPPQFVHDIDPAPIAFRRGELPDPGLPHVAIVGTRRASGIGREIARELGAGLSAAGVVVVSGLALGIDGAAHQGALLAGAAPPIAVVGSGCDMPYPRANQKLWDQVSVAGALLSEAPMGGRPEAWRFPARNRLIVAMSDLVVVVESRSAGGSLLTVDQAIRRGVDVMAVPGSLRNGAAAGTNRLLADGCAPVLAARDVLEALGLDQCGAAERRARVGAETEMGQRCRDVLDAIDDGPTSIDELVSRTGLPASDVFALVAELELGGMVTNDGARVRRC